MKKIIFILIGLFIAITQAQEGSDVPLRINIEKGLPQRPINEMGMDSAFVYPRIDSIITNGIKNNAFPGAQVLVAKNGNS